MLRCSPEAFTKCPTRHLCGRREDATFAKGSDCDKFNQQALFRPMTNADRIRAMSDQELADWLAKTQIDNIGEALKIARIPWEETPDLQNLTAKDCLKWLQQPAEEQE